jgi:LemA protein
MKKGIIILIVLAVIGFGLYSFFKGAYNNLVIKDEAVTTSWSNVQTQYQRRADLIPNLVNIVKGYAEQEKDVLTSVIEARSKASSIQLNAEDLTAENMQQFQAAQTQLSGALSRLLVVVEQYPELKSNQNFLELQAQLEGTENRIAVSRDRFNETVQDYNVYMRQFPRNLVAGMLGFERKTQFQADAAAQQAPTIQF